MAARTREQCHVVPSVVTWTPIDCVIHKHSCQACTHTKQPVAHNSTASLPTHPQTGPATPRTCVQHAEPEALRLRAAAVLRILHKPHKVVNVEEAGEATGPAPGSKRGMQHTRRVAGEQVVALHLRGAAAAAADVQLALAQAQAYEGCSARHNKQRQLQACEVANSLSA